MAGLERRRVLLAQTRQRGHREEPPVVQLLGIPPPRRHPPVLPLQHVAHREAVGGRVQRRGARCQRQHEVVVARRAESVVVARRGCHLDLAAAEHLVERPAAHRQHDALGAVLPVDVERGRARRAAPVGEHVRPPRVLGRVGDALMVRHDVDEDAETGVPCRRDETRQPVGAAAVGVHARGVDDVVAVVGAGRRLQDRRQVRPVDAEVVHVAGDGGRGIQVERRPHLQPIGRGGGAAAVVAHGQCGSSVCGAGERTMSMGTVRAASDAATEWSTSGLSS